MSNILCKNQVTLKKQHEKEDNAVSGRIEIIPYIPHCPTAISERQNNTKAFIEPKIW